MGNVPPNGAPGAPPVLPSDDPHSQPPHLTPGNNAYKQHGPAQSSQPGHFGGSGGRPEFKDETPNMGGRSNSDISMEGNAMGGSNNGSSSNNNNNNAGGTSNVEESLFEDDTVHTVFRWEHGGRQVYITGTFNSWSRQIPMHRSGNDFTYIHNLKRGKHAFKFIVDDEWRFAPDQPTVADIEGRINNFIDVTNFEPYVGSVDFEKEKSAQDSGVDFDNEKENETFSHHMPDVDDYTKEPPPLPPHLRHIILNKPPQLQDTAALPVPQHVALNHLYCTAIKDNMMVLGITQRYKTKFVTTVYYSPCAK